LNVMEPQFIGLLSTIRSSPWGTGLSCPKLLPPHPKVTSRRTIQPTTSCFMTVPPLKALCYHNRGMLSSRLSGIGAPNARPQARGAAAATQERRLFPVACRPLLGRAWHRVTLWDPGPSASSHDRLPDSTP